MSFKIGNTPKLAETSPTSAPGATSELPTISSTGAQIISSLPPHQQVSQGTRPSYYAEIKERLNQGEQPTGAMFREALKRRSPKAIKHLLKRGIDPNVIYSSAKFALKGIVSNIDVLLKNGLDLNRRNRNN